MTNIKLLGTLPDGSRFVQLQTGPETYELRFFDDDGISILYRGSLKGVLNYYRIQRRKLENGGLLHAHANVYR